jgi:iron complex transport system substrate-binding protein
MVADRRTLSGIRRREVDRKPTRRGLLRSLGALGALGVAGCLGDSNSGGSPTATSSATPTPDSDGNGPATETETETGPREVEDATGRTVEIPGRVEEIVAVGPGMLNLVAYLDAVDMLAGVEEPEHTWAKNIPYNIANPELQDLPVVGPHKGGDPELIVDADPDLVVATYFPAGDATDLQSKIDRPVVVVKAQSRPLHRLEAAYRDLEFLANIIGKSERAGEVVDFFESERANLDELSADIPEDERPDAYFAGRSDSGGAGATSTQHPFAPFAFVNVANAADAIEGHASVNEEKLLTWDPEVIFVSGSNDDRVMDALSQGQYANLTAVEEGNLHRLLPTRFYGNLYGNVLADAYYVGSVLYPDAFAGIDPVAKADEIYKTLLGAKIYDEVAENFGGFERLSLS